ncbi:Holliday junction ATP-dependent DNA helicase RuvA [Thalassobacillus devorans]|uniref:Holliday junction branch migration complex subunit RuvA n=1 Tax=Thalassobacillus devorans TaxID=279813 RepID=A0ABQ1P805_9BACI|nr:Holliday junction branch migration protein RuvA [Thalassobacillus devorans]NIK29779.1 Holliday junction DNA helicase RuvA [Thalassobacillus devorans]GGC92749.1 Holliday junction ATP-dependent DNA helicase RuvA [Thalassobacillus devorans]
MIAYVRGKLSVIDDESVIVEANGVGYELICANPFSFQESLEKEIKIHTYHYVREDLQALYGFKKREDKALFSKLLNVSGIGPKGALAVLASTSVRDFVTAIEQEDEKFLTRFPGVGKKTARQMILDLKGKLVAWLPDEDNETSIFYAKDLTSQERSQAVEEALEAMKALGYSERELKALRPKLANSDHANVDDYVRHGLQLMMKN